MNKRTERSNEFIGEIVIDGHSFSKNKGSANAKKITDKSEQVHIQIWYDQHYYYRMQHGDKNGKRNGIGEEIILELVSQSLPHVIYYSFQVSGFSFVKSPKLNPNPLRIIVQKETKDGLLNAALGFQHISANQYEVTVFTAMVIDSFRIGDGQYAILVDDEGSSLSKMMNKKLIEIDTYP